MLHAPIGKADRQRERAQSSSPAPSSVAAPPAPRRERLSHLHGRYGNQAVLRMLDRARPAPPAASPSPVQSSAGTPALVVNTPGDAWEQEADRVADRVMRMAAPVAPVRGRAVLGHAPIAGGGGIAPPIVHDVLRSPGAPLDAATRAFMEPRFGQDFSGVRVHTDARAAASARAVNALAYTVGRNMVFAAGRYAPQTESGRRLLSHELTHTIQQTGEIESSALQRASEQDDCNTAIAKASTTGIATDASAWELGWDWLTGLHPGDRHFGLTDRMTIELMKHEGINDARADALSTIKAECSKDPKTKETARAGGVHYSLGGIVGVWKYIRDASTMATFGITGNLTGTFLGSYNGCWIATMDCCAGRGQIHFHVENTSGLQSAFHLPILGYDRVERPSIGGWLTSPIETWKKYGATLPGSAFENVTEGPMANIKEYFDWDEQVFFPPPQQCSPSGTAPVGRPDDKMHTMRASVATASWIDEASPAGTFVSDAPPPQTTNKSFLTGSSGFRFSNYLEAWIVSTDSSHVVNAGIDSKSGLYNSPSFMGIPSKSYPVKRSYARISEGDIEGIECEQTVGARTVSAEVIGATVSSTFGFGRDIGAAAANMLTNFPPIWTTIRLRLFANGERQCERVRYSYFPSNTFYCDLSQADEEKVYDAGSRQEKVWQAIGWSAGNPWYDARP